MRIAFSKAIVIIVSSAAILCLTATVTGSIFTDRTAKVTRAAVRDGKPAGTGRGSAFAPTKPETRYPRHTLRSEPSGDHAHAAPIARESAAAASPANRPHFTEDVDPWPPVKSPENVSLQHVTDFRDKQPPSLGSIDASEAAAADGGGGVAAVPEDGNPQPRPTRGSAEVAVPGKAPVRDKQVEQNDGMPKQPKKEEGPRQEGKPKKGRGRPSVEVVPVPVLVPVPEQRVTVIVGTSTCGLRGRLWWRFWPSVWTGAVNLRTRLCWSGNAQAAAKDKLNPSEGCAWGLADPTGGGVWHISSPAKHRCTFVNSIILTQNMACLHACGATLCVSRCRARRIMRRAREHIVSTRRTCGRG